MRLVVIFFSFLLSIFGCSSVTERPQKKRAVKPVKKTAKRSLKTSEIKKVIKKQAVVTVQNIERGFTLEQISTRTADRPSYQVQAQVQLFFRKNNQQLQQELIRRRTQLEVVVERIFRKVRKEQINSPRKQEAFKRYLLQAVNGVLSNGIVTRIVFKEFSLP